ncbi:hypothetical protein NOVO_00250 [Rickettsiales bacterium Ac37b]|nr:hypothetical protein NOVO_00250 [Rickettsiales bacterium Ac37b]
MSSKDKKTIYNSKLSKENSINNDKIMKKINASLEIQDKNEDIQVTNSTKADKNASKVVGAIEMTANEMITKVLSKASLLLNDTVLSEEDKEAKQLIIKITNEKDERIRRDAESKIKEIKDNIDKARLAMVNGNYSLAESYLSAAMSLILGNPILKGSALETRIQVVRNEITEVQNGYISVQPTSQINLGFDSNLALSSEIEIEKHLNHLGNKLDDYHKSYYKDSDYRKRIYTIHEKISKGEGIETRESQEYLEHIFEHDNQYRKEQMAVLSEGINAYNELKKTRPLLDAEEKELKHFSNRLSRIQTDFKVHAKFSEWLASTLVNMKDFDMVKEHVLQNSNNTEYIEKLASTIDKIQKNKKPEKSDSILIGHKEGKAISDSIVN